MAEAEKRRKLEAAELVVAQQRERIVRLASEHDAASKRSTSHADSAAVRDPFAGSSMAMEEREWAEEQIREAEERKSSEHGH
jgi:site-specific DNA-cytosine methylase